MTIDLDAIKARLTNADPGPWAIGKKYAAVIVPSMEQDCECSICPPGKSCNDEYGGKLVGESIERHNAEFIANTPSDIAALIEEVERLRGHIDRWVRGPLGHAYLSNLTKPPTAEQLAKHRHNGIGYCKECSGAMALWPCPIEVQRSWKDA